MSDRDCHLAMLLSDVCDTLPLGRWIDTGAVVAVLEAGEKAVQGSKNILPQFVVGTVVYRTDFASGAM